MWNTHSYVAYPHMCVCPYAQTLHVDDHPHVWHIRRMSCTHTRRRSSHTNMHLHICVVYVVVRVLSHGSHHMCYMCAWLTMHAHVSSMCTGSNENCETVCVYNTTIRSYVYSWTGVHSMFICCSRYSIYLWLYRSFSLEVSQLTNDIYLSIFKCIYKYTYLVIRMHYLYSHPYIYMNMYTIIRIYISLSLSLSISLSLYLSLSLYIYICQYIYIYIIDFEIDIHITVTFEWIRRARDAWATQHMS